MFECCDDSFMEFLTQQKKDKVIVNKFTRAFRLGKRIYCRGCNHPTIAYNFSWHSLKCKGCDKLNHKTNYYYIVNEPPANSISDS